MKEVREIKGGLKARCPFCDLSHQMIEIQHLRKLLRSAARTIRPLAAHNAPRPK